MQVLIADDQTLVREGTREILERHDEIEVVGEAADGEEAVALTERLQPDIVIVDIGMPRMNGIEATRRIKASFPDIKVLVLTVHDEDPYVFAILEAGAAGYLLKDVRGAQLIDAVLAVNAGESVLQPTIARKILDRFYSPPGSPINGGQRQTLTEREMQVLKLTAPGMTNKEIAAELDLSVRTVQVHLSHIFEKLGVASRIEAVIYGLRSGWFSLEELG